MVQETVRYSDAIVKKVNELVEEGTFETKSEFYRFATEMLLDSMCEDYAPEMLKYDIVAERTRQQVGESSEESDGSMFYNSAIIVRRHARRGEIDAAEEYIDTHYASERGEYLLLESLLDYYCDTSKAE
jgi:Arc/MetJ-type ribon-helix-helix transcriptional regulator